TMMGIDEGETVFEPIGCEQCGHSGYKGRIGVFEAIRVDETIRRLINEGSDETAIARHAFRNTPSLADAARALVRAGMTTPEEAVRVSRRDATDPVVEPSGG
ncbi:MAG: type II secretion system protein GspE, partial [Pseudomonadota bacterium]|nr:type II secretion system protein GspE [Pseudomonadota bacterium]